MGKAGRGAGGVGVAPRFPGPPRRGSGGCLARAAGSVLSAVRGPRVWVFESVNNELPFRVLVVVFLTLWDLGGVVWSPRAVCLVYQDATLFPRGDPRQGLLPTWLMATFDLRNVEQTPIPFAFVVQPMTFPES